MNNTTSEKARPLLANGRATSPTTSRRPYNTRRRGKQLFACRKATRRAGGDDATPSWRDFFKVHPACAEWPELPADERKALRADIEANYVKVPIQTRQVAGGDATYVIDGRTRLDLMEELGRQIVNAKGEWIGALIGKVEHMAGRTHEEIGLEVISYNGKRRHMTKQRLAECIVGTLKAARELRKVTPESGSRQVGEKLPSSAEISSRQVGEVTPEPRWTKGVRGSTKDKFKAAAVERIKQAGISKRTVERVLAKAKPGKPKKEVDRLAPEYIHKRFGKFLNHWPSHTDQRKVREHLFTYLKP